VAVDILAPAAELAPARTRRIVVIAESERQAVIRSRFAPTTQVEFFAVAELPRALAHAVAERPHIVALDAGVASSAMGRTLINTLLKNRTLAGCEIRVVAPAPGNAHEFDLDPACRRAAVRVRPAGIEVQVDGQPAQLVDLSARGAQILSTTVLKPNQRLRLALVHAGQSARAHAAVVWASFEMPTNEAPRYRAGLEFAGTPASFAPMAAFVSLVRQVGPD
jgi:hypothetical protein